jgi:hypothetical protein
MPLPELARLTPPERTARIRRVTARLCLAHDWAPLHEVRLGNGRRADILALRPDGSFVCIEIKSDMNDFRADRKWHHYRDFSDALYFAVDLDFPLDLLPADTGLIVADETAEVLREAPIHPLAPARRRSVLQRFALLAASRLAAVEDPVGASMLRTALRYE